MIKKVKSDFLKHTITLLSGNIVSQAIAFAIYPLLARMYSAVDFGTLAIFTSIFSLLRIASTGRYDFAIVMSESEQESNALFRLSIGINLLFSLGVLLIIVIGKIYFPLFSYFQKLGWFVYLVPLMVFLTGFCLSACYYLNKQKQYKTMAKADITINSSVSIFKLGFGVVKFTHIGLIVASIIGQFAGVVYYFSKVGKKPFKERKNTYPSVAKKYKNFPLYVMPKEFLHTLSMRLPFLILVFYFETELLGFLSMAITLSLTPIGLFAGGLTKVLYQQIAENVQKKTTIILFFKNYTKKIFFAALPVFIILYFFAEPVFSFVLSKEWGQSATYFRFILPWMFIYLIASPFDFIPNLFSEQKKAVIFDFIYMLLCFIGLEIGILENSFSLAVILFGTAGIINFLFLFFWYFHLIKQYEMKHTNLQ